MKKSLLLISVLLYSFNCLAQELDLVYAAITKPQGMVKMTKQQIPAFTKAHFKNNEELKTFVYNNDKTVYRVGNILIVINCEKRMEHEPPLEKTQQFLAPMGPTELKHMNDKTCLKLTQELQGVHLFRFLCVDKAQKYLLAGLIQYEPADKAKATRLLNDLIRTLRFKV